MRAAAKSAAIRKPGKRRRGDGVHLPLPAGLTDDGKREWYRVTRLLRDQGTLHQLDRTAISDYLNCWERLRECEAELTDKGLLIDGREGTIVRNPAAMLARQYRLALIAWSEKLGLTPMSRLRLGAAAPAPAPAEHDPWASFLPPGA